MRLSFNSDTHAYEADGRRLPSVTEILRAVGIYSNYGFAEGHHRYRGAAVHQGCAILDLGGTPRLGPVPSALQQVADDIVNGYWPSFVRFKERVKWQGKVWECPIIDPIAGYGGTFDSVGLILTLTRLPDESYGYLPDCGELTLLDLKSGVLPDLVPVQLAAYADLILRGIPVNPEHPGWEWLQEAARSGVPMHRRAVRLEKDGKDTMFSATSKGQGYDLPMWLTVWRSCLNVYHLRTQYGIKEDR